MTDPEPHSITGLDRAFTNTIGMCALIFGVLSGVVFVFSVAVVFIVGAWDLLVWLTKEDWRTTHFSVPQAGLIFLVIAWVLKKQAFKILDWSEERVKLSDKATKNYYGF